MHNILYNLIQAGSEPKNTEEALFHGYFDTMWVLISDFSSSELGRFELQVKLDAAVVSGGSADVAGVLGDGDQHHFLFDGFTVLSQDRVDLHRILGEPGVSQVSSLEAIWG